MEKSEKVINELIEALNDSIGKLSPKGSLVERIGEERYLAILRKTVHSLPDRPSDAGMTSAQIKAAFYRPITDEEGSLYAELNRIADELNLAGEEIEKALTKISEILAEIYNNSVDKKTFDNKMKEVGESIDKCMKRAEGVEGEQVYASAGGKDQLVPISSEALPNTAVKRDNAGHVKVTAPAAEDDAVSLGYAERTFAQKGDVPTSVANALIGSEMGEVVALKDVSPLEHNLGVKVESKNLLPYPYFETTKTVNGITFTDNGDGSITMNGTCSGGRAIFNLYANAGNESIFKMNRNLMISGAHKESYSSYGYLIEVNCYNVNSGAETWLGDDGNGCLLAPEWALKNLYILVKDGAVLNNVTIYPMVESGTTKSGYTPYIADIESVKVLAQGKNLISYPYENTTKTTNGITFTDNGDGSITAKGTATSDAYFILSYHKYYGKGNINAINNENGDTNGTYAGSKRLFYSSDNAYLPLSITIAGGQTVDETIYPQVELGTVSTAYEPYKEPIEYAQGEDIKSIYPSTTLMTDTEGAVISVEYNKDINKAFEELMNLILSLGGNVYV